MKRSVAFINKRLLRAMLLMMSVLMAMAALASAVSAESKAAGPAVYVIHAEQTIESGLESYLKRAYKEAEEASAERVILVLDTFGGEIGSAQQIGELLRNSKVPTTAFVKGKAFSAGTYIALNADQIAMQDNSAIGAAAVVDGQGNLIENPKTISAWTKLMTEAAKLNNRNTDVAAAMVDPNLKVDIKELGKTKERGEILSLSTDEALQVGYAEFKASSIEEVLRHLDLSGRTVVEVGHTFLEQLGQFLTSPIVKTLLLILGIAGVAIELIVPGFGIPGIIGIIGFGLYFFAHYIIGFAGMEDVVLFVLGIVLLISELFVSSFGILGILGSASLIAGVVMASPNAESGLWSLLAALIAAAIVVFFVAQRFKSRGVWNKFILRDSLTTEEGYVSNENKVELLGQVGQTLTPLRPAGTMQLGDERIDVVTSGEFIAAGTRVEVIKVEGTRVVVRQCQ
ncbi:nodulation protein NfeD [Paenibacillus sp. GCM10027626]|uniref:NfeD family protein n=1 Tax=Paenibacillus sp. GCM10027626 TaxID=3273411 RepID=UPI00362624EC